MTTVLICGGRNYGVVPTDTAPPMVAEALKKARVEAEALFAFLDALHKRRPIARVIHGAARGADTIGGEWARSRRVPCTPYRAEWGKFGKQAGPTRNAKMLTDGKPDLVVACRGTNGTADMIRRSRDAGVEVMLVP